jgi:general secretion pathway protein I
VKLQPLPPTPSPQRERGSQRAFTLLEVLVSVAILGLSLTAILAAQAGAVSGTGHAKNLGVAVGLARCKMTELEEHLRVDGLPEVSEEGSGACCNDADTPPFACSWVVERPTFPDAEYGKLDLDTKLDSTALGKLAGEGSEQLAQGADLGSLAQNLAGGEGDLAELASGGVQGLASMVMSMVYPDLKTMFEASMRRVTVTLTWTEGSRSYDFQVVQWVAQPQPGMLGDTADLEDALSGAGQGQGTGTNPNASGNPKSSRGTSTGPRTERAPGGER